jgi:hypothetical protein
MPSCACIGSGISSSGAKPIVSARQGLLRCAEPIAETTQNCPPPCAALTSRSQAIDTPTLPPQSPPPVPHAMAVSTIARRNAIVDADPQCRCTIGVTANLGTRAAGLPARHWRDCAEASPAHQRHGVRTVPQRWRNCSVVCSIS